ncbi:MAG: proton extrusion protein PcxA [Microcoleus vaginatus WJT46-NPBG5]|jgi:hypothetical protein|nr:proton extrusion protein PcxA [Microcoleus vaginatus WJT46-NPBG5]
MKFPNFNNFKGYLRSANQWISETPDRNLDEAYDAALMIKAIEDEHFNGRKISAESARYSDSIMTYFQGELIKYLNLAKLKLAAFNTSRSVLSLSPLKNTKTKNDHSIEYHNLHEQEVKDQAAIVLEKLNFIDEVLAKYTYKPVKPSSATSSTGSSASLVTVYQTPTPESLSPTVRNNSINLAKPLADDVNSDKMAESINDKTSFLPRSILRTLDRLKRQLDPKAEEEVVRDFRSSKTKTIISMKFILLLLLIPLLTHQISRNFVVGPLIDRFRDEQPAEVFLNADMEEEAFSQLQRFEEHLKFQRLIGAAPKISDEEMEEEVKQKAHEIAEEYRKESASAIKNVFSDLLSVIAFGMVIFSSKREISILKSFMDDIVYGLSDSAKAFIIILFTDIFVGFHSPHGWEVILEGISRHLGLPENRQFIFLFIATFPVILDTVFKYWIFRYLNRISPSAVATYRNMNE